jgi:hypothetical protein
VLPGRRPNAKKQVCCRSGVIVRCRCSDKDGAATLTRRRTSSRCRRGGCSG